MLRVLALLTYLAVLLAPLSPAQAHPACAMEAGGAPHIMSVAATDPGGQMPMPAHHSVAEVCKQMCSALAILPPVEPGAFQAAISLPPPRPSVSFLASQPPPPSERPPKRPV